MTKLPLSNSGSAPTIHGAASTIVRSPGFRLPDRLSLETAGKAFMQGPDAIEALANQLGFKAPAADRVAAQVVTGWVNSADGAVFIAPTAGWQPASPSWYPLVGVGADWLARFIPPKPAPVKPDQPVKPIAPEVMPPEIPADKPGHDWSLARELSEQEWLSLRKNLTLLREHPDLLAERADALDFTPPGKDTMTAQVLIGWINASTGDGFVAPSSGWTPPSDAWKIVAKIPHADLPPSPKPPLLAVDPVDPPPVPIEPPPPPVDKIRMIGHVLKAVDPVEAFVRVGKADDAPDSATRIDYQWRLGDKVIEGATSLKLPMMPLLAGKEISVEISVSDPAGIRESLTASLDAAPEAIREAAGKLMHWARRAELTADKDPGDAADPARPAEPADTRREFTAPERWDVEGVDFSRFAVRASTAPAPEDDAAVNAADVLAALKLSHGRNPNADPDGRDSPQASSPKPFQLIAADIDGNGVVNRADAEALLRDMTESTEAAAKHRWLFIPERAELSDVSRHAVHWHEPPPAAEGSAPENWIGVMLGDIDGSWRADPSAPLT